MNDPMQRNIVYRELVVVVVVVVVAAVVVCTFVDVNV
jgi:hypothetical protein